ncbi:NUDIX hydrolase [Thermovenabulum gondwanense]|uniref:ADP-ribose pyrophosphatase n=1 Tax=Thermovenabulum gondwanense TaxID=520767 RepID=A0A161PU57_9FIRM|nr:NUDIX hydrolase [Thermovenabulum gondwanense]KYO65801.1 ADP-ribose pyrophosphatase [Thermovenabulum gondwanense]
MEFFEETIDSKKVYQGKIINLKIERVKLPNGKESTREIVEHPGAVAIVPVNEKNEVIMVRQFRKAVDKVLLEIPAGKIEKNEDVEECAQRELMEETGYRSRKLVFLADFYTSPGFSDERMYLFLAKDLFEAKGTLDEDEMISVEKIPLTEAVLRAYRGEIKDGKTLAGLLLAEKFLSEGKL